MSDNIELAGHVIDGWHERVPKWRVMGTSYQTEPDVEDDGVIRVVRRSRIATVRFTLERDRPDDIHHPERQLVETSGYVIINDPPTLLLAFPLEEAPT